jgi:hypothetical protein
MKTPFCIVVFLLASTALGVGSSHWMHTTEADFKTGTFDNVVATNLGDLKLSRAVKTLLEQDPKISAVNALAQAVDGTVYAGSGPHGVLLRISGETVTTIATLEDDTNIFSLLIDQKGRLLIGTGGEHGRILRLDNPGARDAKPVEIFKADGVQYIWSICQTPEGNLYAATGPTGKLFEIKPDGSQKVVMDSDENNLTSMVSDGKETLYVGTDPNGLVYRVNRKTGESFVLYDAPETEISALVLDKKGNLFAATAEAREDLMPAAPGAPGEAGGRPEGGSAGIQITTEPPKEPAPGKLPDPNPGRPDPIPQFPITQPPARSHLFVGAELTEKPKAAARPAATQPKPPRVPPPPPGAPRPTTAPMMPEPPMPAHQPPVEPAPAEARPEGNAIYKIDPDGFVTEIFRQPVLVLSMIENNGTLLIATGGEGQIYQVNPAADEVVVLAKVEPKQIMCLLPARDGRILMGMANAGGVAAMSSGFATRGTYTSAVLDATQISRFGKMHMHGSLAKATALKVATRSGNLKDAAEKGWSSWTDDVPATEFLQVRSPSARFLQYRVTFSSDDGSDTPIIEDVNIAYQMPNLPPQVKSVKVASSAEAGAAAALPNGMPLPAMPAGEGESAAPRIASGRRQTISWEASDPNGDALQYSIYFRRGVDAPWILLKEKLPENSFEWDTRSVADGRYEVKVIASDAAANVPGRGRTASRVADPILVDNTPPVIGDVKWSQRGADIRVEFRVVDRSGIVAAGDYSVDSSKEWQALLPSDGIWDSPQETADFTITGLAPGTHQVTIRTTDDKGNPAFENLIVKVIAPAASR